MFDKLVNGVSFAIVGGFLTLVIFFTLWLLRRRSKRQPRGQWEQMVGRTHREGQSRHIVGSNFDPPLTNAELAIATQTAEFLEQAKLRGITVDKKKLEKLLNPNVEDVLEEARISLDDIDPLNNLYTPTVQAFETRADVAARQEREQQMFGGGVKRRTPENDEN